MIDYYAAKALRPDDDIIICAGDVETDGLGGKLLMVQWGYLGQVYYDTSEKMIEKFFDAFFNMPSPAVWFFHFGQYDWRYFLDYIEEQKYQCKIGLRTETDIYEIRIRRNDKEPWCILRDSYALWSFPLATLAERFCPEFPKKEIDIEHFDPNNQEHIDYARRDIEILLVGLPRLFEMIYEHFGVNPSATIAGTALKGWQKTLGQDEIYNCQPYNETEEFIRQSYYGGIVFLTSVDTFYDCTTYDINSSYPAAMTEYGVPYGAPIYTTEYDETIPGIYRIKVKTPDDLVVAILPARNKKGNMRWYRGEFETVVTNIEIEFAKKHGYEILDIYEGYQFEKTVFPFNEFITKCKLIRQAYKGKTQETVAKLMQNSLYGKYGSRRDRPKLVHNSLLDDDDFGMLPFDETGIWYIQKEFDETMRCLPQWAVFITANARLRLLRAVYAIGPKNVLYGDTDSITIVNGEFDHLIDVGNDYGQWKKEKQWKVFRPIAPKVYSGILKNGEYKGAAKGLPSKNLTSQHWKELLENGKTNAQVLSLSSLKIAIKKGTAPAQLLVRKSSTLDHSENFTIDGKLKKAKF